MAASSFSSPQMTLRANNMPRRTQVPPSLLHLPRRPPFHSEISLFVSRRWFSSDPYTLKRGKTESFKMHSSIGGGAGDYESWVPGVGDPLLADAVTCGRMYSSACVARELVAEAIEDGGYVIVKADPMWLDLVVEARSVEDNILRYTKALAKYVSARKPPDVDEREFMKKYLQITRDLGGDSHGLPESSSRKEKEKN